MERIRHALGDAAGVRWYRAPGLNLTREMAFAASPTSSNGALHVGGD